MQIKIIKRKASSLKELDSEIVEMNDVKTLRELLIQLTVHEFMKQHILCQEGPLSLKEIQSLKNVGKISFGSLYNDEKGDLEKAIHVTLQDFEDGLFRVFLNGEEYYELDEMLCFQEDNEVVFIKLVMLAGRLW